MDVDEFVQPLDERMGGKTVFDLAQKMRFGCVSFTGAWAFAPQTMGPTLQRNHTHTDPARTCKNPKWCIVPGGLADRFPLAVHRPAGPLFKLTHLKDLKYWHFCAATTGWKSVRYETSSGGAVDAHLQDILSGHLQAPEGR